MITLHQARQKIISELAAIGIDESERLKEADLIVEHVTEWGRAQQILHQDDQLHEDFARAIEAIVEKRKSRLPLQYCLGHAWFMGLRLAVEPGVFIPRADTETVVTVALGIIARESRPLWQITEIGTGSGAIAVALLKQVANSHVVGIDTSAQAVDVSRRNARASAVESRMELRLGDWQSLLPKEIDLVVSNPPYIPACDEAGLAPEVRVYEPRLALYGGDEDGLAFYRSFASQTGSHLAAQGGWAVVEVGYGQAPEVERIFAQNGWLRVEQHLDMQRIARVVSAFHE